MIVHFACFVRSSPANETGSKDAATHRPVQRWGKTLEFIGAPATGDLILGERHYARPEITARPDIPHDFQEH